VTTSVLVDPDPAGVGAALARAGNALDLRTVAAYDDAWAALGFVPVDGDELALPLPQALADVAATEALGARLGGLLAVGDLVVLSGPLGAGKTALTRGLGAALGVSGSVTSPTFVLARRHRGPVPLLHVDAYRLRGSGAGASARAEALEDLDLDAALEEGVVVVEWGEGLVDALAPSRLEVRLERAQSQGRTAYVRPVGPRWRVTKRDSADIW
jgi:tRNA threonylcarbamoyladenosine biosynthesis protein TsaE